MSFFICDEYFDEYSMHGDRLSEKLEMLGNLTAVREMSGNWRKVRELKEKCCQEKLFIVNLTFGAIPVFSGIVLVHCERESKKNR